ncbi:MAG TPA: sigma-70 family RNA polymerase sigma factor [Planctomycetota bacterium]|nr:sigma-70 family RNA polymerase sigma factor [Planctomycetota bacterium]
MIELTDDESKALMTKIARGDRTSFQTLVEGHQAALERFISRTLDTTIKDTIAAVSHEVWITVFMKAESYKPSVTARFSTWLLEVAKKHCMRHAKDPLRKKARDKKALAKADLRREEVEEPDHLEERDMMDAIKTKLLGMAIEKREALVLRFFLGLTVEEVAVAQSAPLDTVKSRITSALNKLRAIFARES